MPQVAEGRVARARQYTKSPEFTKLWRYCTVSGISTGVSLAGLFLFYRVVGLSPGWANVVATCIATVPSYYLNRTWAWGKSGRSHLWREVVPFWVLSFIGLGVSSLAVWGAGSWARHDHLGHASTSVLVNGANLASFAVLWVGKFIVYNKLFHIPAVEFDEHHGEQPGGELDDVVDAASIG